MTWEPVRGWQAGASSRAAGTPCPLGQQRGDRCSQTAPWSAQRPACPGRARLALPTPVPGPGDGVGAGWGCSHHAPAFPFWGSPLWTPTLPAFCVCLCICVHAHTFLGFFLLIGSLLLCTGFFWLHRARAALELQCSGFS